MSGTPIVILSGRFVNEQLPSIARAGDHKFKENREVETEVTR
jgi:hypothetical protein